MIDGPPPVAPSASRHLHLAIDHSDQYPPPAIHPCGCCQGAGITLGRDHCVCHQHADTARRQVAHVCAYHQDKRHPHPRPERVYQPYLGPDQPHEDAELQRLRKEVRAELVRRYPLRPSKPSPTRNSGAAGNSPLPAKTTGALGSSRPSAPVVYYLGWKDVMTFGDVVAMVLAGLASVYFAAHAADAIATARGPWALFSGGSL